MISVGIKELKTRLSSYVDMVKNGEEVIITSRGKDVAVVVPISQERNAVKNLMDSGRAKWTGGKPQGVRDVRIKGKPLSKTILEERR